MGSKIELLKKAMLEAKKVPKTVWIAAIVIPGGFTALGLYFAVKSLKKSEVEKSARDLINEWKKND